MENILKLTVKKEVFNNLATGEQRFISLDASNYWIKRLALDSTISLDELKKSQEFKNFDKVSVSCLKDNNVYDITNIELKEDNIIIWVFFEGGNEVAPETEKTEEINEVVEEPKKEDIKVVEPIKSKEVKTIKVSPKSIDIQSVVNDIIDVMGYYDNVVIVSRPVVIIPSNGRIFGTKNRININNDQEIKFEIGTEKILYDTKNDEEFLDKVEKYLCNLAESYYLFIWKNACKFVHNSNGVKYLKLRIAKKKFRI